ncbi:MAG: BMP family ABC transporter substrate-binding protein [Desulfobacterales bacterium]|nr:BMP family ABC transporter substrate-binding protein [Desulfobacterales bacterium]
MLKKTKKAIMLFVFIFSLAASFPAISASKELKIGFMYVSPISDAGWTYVHDLGRKALETIPGLTVKFVESVDEGIQTESILTYFAQNNYDLIFATSYGYMDPVIKIAESYPNVIFMHCSGNKRAKNVGVYFGRIYQPRYLTGIAAGGMTRSNLIGYVAAYPIPEVIQGINAFTLGAQSVNPDVKVHVVWTKTWYDPVKEKAAAESLLDKGVDVITQHQDSPATQVAAQKRNVYCIGYNTDMSKFAPKAHLISAIWNWEIIYRHIVNQVLNGTWKSEDILWGIEKGAVDISPVSNLVPPALKEKIQTKKQALISGELLVFQGPVNDQKGVTRIKPKERNEDAILLNMNWFVNGVVGNIE